MTHEEIMTSIARNELRSYKQLPQIWYQIQAKFRDEPRPKSGLLRVRQFTMKDSYSFDIDKAGLDKSFELHDEIYRELTYVGDAGYLAQYYPYTIVANSLSKSNALTGMRIGWLIAPDAAIDALVKMHTWVTSTASAFGQRVAYEIFGEPGALTEQSAWYRVQRELVLDALDASGLQFAPVDGAFPAAHHGPGRAQIHRASWRSRRSRDRLRSPR